MQGEEAMTAPLFDIRQEVVDIDCLCGQDARLADNLQVAAGIGFGKVHLIGEEEPFCGPEFGAALVHPFHVHLVDITEYINAVAGSMDVAQKLFVHLGNSEQHSKPGIAHLLLGGAGKADGEDGRDKIRRGDCAGLIAVDEFGVMSAEQSLRRDGCGGIIRPDDALKGIERAAHIEVNQYAAKVK